MTALVASSGEPKHTKPKPCKDEADGRMQLPQATPKPTGRTLHLPLLSRGTAAEVMVPKGSKSS